MGAILADPKGRLGTSLHFSRGDRGFGVAIRLCCRSLMNEDTESFAASIGNPSIW